MGFSMASDCRHSAQSCSGLWLQNRWRREFAEYAPGCGAAMPGVDLGGDGT